MEIKLSMGNKAGLVYTSVFDWQPNFVEYPSWKACWILEKEGIEWKRNSVKECKSGS
jgi:hypothetical protein